VKASARRWRGCLPAKAFASRWRRGKIEKLGALCAETGARAFACDATDADEVERLFAGRARDRRADVVVYNASGVSRRFVDLVPPNVAQAITVSAFGGVAGKGAGAGLGAERAELLDFSAPPARRRMPSRANSRASDALRPSPAPTIRAVLYLGNSMSAVLE